MPLGPAPRPAADRFWAKVDKTPDCWAWTGALSVGYGRFYVARGAGRVLAHRFAYEVLVGPIPDGLMLDHLCRNTRCVNPAHLEPVDNRTNVLRGVGPAAEKARRTHCFRGHEFTDANTIVERGTGRSCRTCRYERNNARRRALTQARRQAS